jgi:hypothetical protein
MGGIGFLGGSIAQPALGRIYDLQLQKYGDELAAGSATLQYVIILTVIVAIAFLYLFMKNKQNTK